jgi:hypothetical protein
MDQHALQAAINRVATTELEKFHCTGGTLHCESRQSGNIVTLHGTKSDGKIILIWPDTKVLRSFTGPYLDTMPGAAGFNLDINLTAQTYVYKSISPAQIHARDTKETKELEEAVVQQKLDTKRDLQSRSTPFGRQLAEAVARKLQTYPLCNSHRDYCGMGLEFRDGVYCYGEVYDGGLDPVLRFTSSEAFVEWLSKQSDASLGRLEEKDPWYWGNQTLNRERLEGF